MIKDIKISMGMLAMLYKTIGLTVDINNGKITGVHFCDKSTENCTQR